jgi:hypothetical protein
MASDKLPHRERRPSVGAPIVDIQGSVGPAGISRPKHKRTLTGFGAGEIKHIEGMHLSPLFPPVLVWDLGIVEESPKRWDAKSSPPAGAAPQP